MDKKTDYALRAATYLAMQYQTGGTSNTAEISKASGAPKKFLAQILLALKNNAILSSTPGRDGGYRLTRRPELISVAEVISAVSRKKNKISSVNLCSTGAYARASQIAGAKAESAVRKVMSEMSLARLAERAKAGETNPHVSQTNDSD